MPARDVNGDLTTMEPMMESHETQDKVKVLIADDVAAFRRLLQIVLEKDGRYDVVATAVDGKDAIRRAHEASPDLVLLDLSMPTMDGLEALPEIRDASPRCTIVVLSGFQQDRMERSAKEIGAAGYVEKGLPPDHLLAALERILNEGRPDLPGFSDDDLREAGRYSASHAGRMPGQEDEARGQEHVHHVDDVGSPRFMSCTPGKGEDRTVFRSPFTGRIFAVLHPVPIVHDPTFAVAAELLPRRPLD